MDAVAIVVPAYRSERTIARSLGGFRREAPEAEIVVVDSGPVGGSAALAGTVPGVTAVRSETRLLPHQARKLGLDLTEAPLILFTDPDIYPRPGSVAALLAARERHGGAVVAALACHGARYLDRGAHSAKFDMWLPRPGVVPVAVGPTAGLLVSRSDLERVGGIPGGWLGDTEFCWALTEAGVPIHLVGNAVFEHDHGVGLRDLVRERYVRGGAFAPLRASRSPGAGARVRDIALTATLLRPGRVTARSASATWRHVGKAEALATLPVVAAGQLAWFAGELTGHVALLRSGTTS